jgi:acyl-CoA thioesterase I
MKVLMTLSIVAAYLASLGAGAETAAARTVPTSSAMAEARRAASAPLKIVAFGDSLTSGHRLGERSAYPAILARRLHDADLPAVIVNRGVSGDTTAGALRRLTSALDLQPQILIVALGANDGLRGVPVAQVRGNLERIIEGAQARGIQVLLCGMEALPLYGWQYTVEFHQIFPALAAKYRVPLVPFLLDRVIGDSTLMSPDGIHPNAEGAKVLADNIWPYLLPLARVSVNAAG